jgi:hypothetical protein
MSVAQVREPLRLPASRETQLRGVRRHIWTIKTRKDSCLPLIDTLSASSIMGTAPLI